MTDGAPFDRLTAEGSGVDMGLLLAPAMASGVDEACTGLLQTSKPTETNVLFVTTRPGDRAVARFRAHSDADPNEIAIVTLGRAATAAGEVDDGLVTHHVSIENPTNLTRVGVEITKILDGWTDDDVEITVCVDSVTALLQYAEERVVYRFLAELIDRFRQADAWAHFHLDPDAHEQSTVSSMLQLYDVVIDRTGEEETVERTESEGVSDTAEDHRQR